MEFLLFQIFALLVITNGKRPAWVEVPLNVLLNEKNGYSPFEACVANLTNLHKDEFVYSSGQCLAALGNDSAVQLLKNGFRGQKVSPMCLLGYCHGKEGSLRGFFPGRKAKHRGETCKLRTIEERTGVRSKWTGLKTATDVWSYAGDLLSSMILNGADRYILVGDTMTNQKGKFLGCDLARSDGIVIANTKNDLLDVNLHPRSSAEFYLEPTNPLIPPLTKEKPFSISLNRYTLPCPDEVNPDNPNCIADKDFSRRIYNTYKAEMLQYLSGGGVGNKKKVLELNFGLHVVNEGDLHKEYFEAILNIAKEGRGSFYVLWRETSAQHFAFRKNGLYFGENTGSNHSNSGFPPDHYCCDALSSHDPSSRYDVIADWRNVKARTFLDELDPLWSRYIGWVPFYDFTDTLYDMHLEANYAFNSDCTHLLYTPFLMAKHYVDTQVAFDALVKVDKIAIADARKDVIGRFSTGMHLVKGNLRDKTVFKVENGVRRAIPDGDTFLRMRHSWSDVETVAHPAMEAIPLGHPLPVLTDFAVVVEIPTSNTTAGGGVGSHIRVDVDPPADPNPQAPLSFTWLWYALVSALLFILLARKRLYASVLQWLNSSNSRAM